MMLTSKQANIIPKVCQHLYIFKRLIVFSLAFSRRVTGWRTKSWRSSIRARKMKWWANRPTIIWILHVLQQQQKRPHGLESESQRQWSIPLQWSTELSVVRDLPGPLASSIVNLQREYLIYKPKPLTAQHLGGVHTQSQHSTFPTTD